MDSIEKAMLGRLSNPVGSQSTGVPSAFSATEKVIERVGHGSMISIVNDKAPGVRQQSQRSVTLDKATLQAAGLLVPDSQRSQIKEEYRHIKRPLLMNADRQGATQVEHPHLIGVTSARSGEGKTFTACNLALSIASEKHRAVLLVDTDIFNPSVARMLGFAAARGLVDFLANDRMELADVLVDTDIASLAVLPTGNRSPLPTELLATNNLRRLMAEINQRYSDHIVIFDTPPLLDTSDARILAALMGQVVMVIEAEHTLQTQVKEALALLDADQIVGLVLNKSRDLFTANYYGKYGYQYSRQEIQEEDSGT